MPAELPWPALTVNEDNRSHLLETLGLGRHRPVLGLCPGAEYGDAKKWPEEHYAALAAWAIERGMQVWIFGSDKDTGTAARIGSAIQGSLAEWCADLTGRTRLEDAVDLLSLCELVVSNDSGLMHVAAAVGCATAVVYGSTSPAFTPPLTDRVYIVADDLPCSPCFERTCPLGHKNCLNLLMPERLEAIVARHAGLGER